MDRLKLFRRILVLRKTPCLCSQEGKTDPTVTVSFYNPSGFWAWYVTEWDSHRTCFGYVWHEKDLAFFSLYELVLLKGRMGTRVEVDFEFKPQPLSQALSGDRHSRVLASLVRDFRMNE